MSVLFPQQAHDKCRVCNEPVVDGRWNYCSTRCREIAQAVQKMFIWDSVREMALVRDDHTCQRCGLSKEMADRAYWQIREIVDERETEGADWFELWERYGEPSVGAQTFEVDHIERIADGGHPFAEDNLQTLCEYCHADKTADENSKRESAPEITLADYMDA